MAHFAEIDENNNVINVIVVNNDSLLDENNAEQENNGIDLLESIYGHRNWVQTSYNTFGGTHYDDDGSPSDDQSGSFRKNFAGSGSSVWDSSRDAFYFRQPYPSWTLNETTCRWECPAEFPDEQFQSGSVVMWNEDTQQWDIT